MSEQLKPCPFCGFCGGSNIIVSETDDESMSGFDAVECDDCGCEMMGSTAADWNTRALTPKQQHADEMYDVLNKVMDWYIYGDGEMPTSIQQSASSLLAKARGEQ